MPHRKASHDTCRAKSSWKNTFPGPSNYDGGRFARLRWNHTSRRMPRLVPGMPTGWSRWGRRGLAKGMATEHRTRAVFKVERPPCDPDVIPKGNQDCGGQLQYVAQPAIGDRRPATDRPPWLLRCHCASCFYPCHMLPKRSVKLPCVV